MARSGTVTLTDLDRGSLARARGGLAQAGLIDRCRFEPAGDGLEALARAEAGLDIVFLDGEKTEYPRALAGALPQPGAGGPVLPAQAPSGGGRARGEGGVARAPPPANTP